MCRPLGRSWETNCHNCQNCQNWKPDLKRLLLLLKIEQASIHLEFAVTKSLGQVVQQISGNHGIFMEHVAGKISGESMQVHGRGHAYVLQECGGPDGVELQLLGLVTPDLLF